MVSFHSHYPPCERRKRWPKTYIFGYGSLIAAIGINGRFMKRRYTELDVTECVLNGYKRSFCAVSHGGFDWFTLEDIPTVRYFGIEKIPGHTTNGVIFEISEQDMFPFKASEGGDRLYSFEDVRKDIILSPNFNISKNARILTCVAKLPSTIPGFVTKRYVQRCKDALAFRSPAFRAAFGTVESYLP